MEKPISRLIDSVGVATFVKYFKQFSDLNKGRTTKSKISELFGENSEKWTDGSIAVKINGGLKIFTLNRELEAIDHILYVKKTGNIPNGIEIKRQAELIKKSLTESWVITWNWKVEIGIKTIANTVYKKLLILAGTKLVASLLASDFPSENPRPQTRNFPYTNTLCVTLKPTAHLAHLVFADTKANPKKTKRAKSPTADKRLVGNFI